MSRLGFVLVALIVCGGLLGTALVAKDRNILGGEGPGRELMAAIPYWDQVDAVKSLRDHPGHVTVATTWSYGVDANGVPSLQEGLTTRSETQLTTELKQLGLSVVPSIANTTKGLWDEANIARIMKDPKRRSAHIKALVELVLTNDYDGLQLDYENLGPEDREPFTQTVKQLAEALHDEDKQLWVTVHAKESDAGYDARNLAQDYRALGSYADRIVLMAYDWHWETSPAGPIAPIDWVERVVRYSVTQVPPEKLVLGIGLFGYDWGSAPPAKNLTWGQIREQAAQHPADERWDVGSQSPHFSYEADGIAHEVWYENGRSVDLKVHIARSNRLGGIALWRLGREDPTIWDVFGGPWPSGNAA